MVVALRTLILTSLMAINEAKEKLYFVIDNMEEKNNEENKRVKKNNEKNKRVNTRLLHLLSWI
jgi:hypothetical protein